MRELENSQIWVFSSCHFFQIFSVYGKDICSLSAQFPSKIDPTYVDSLFLKDVDEVSGSLPTEL